MANHTLIRGVLSITIGKAKHLGHEKTLLSKVTSVITCSTHVPMVDNSGTYVKVNIGALKIGETKHIGQNRSLRWQETFRIDLAHEAHTILIEVHCDDIRGDKVVGVVAVSVEDMVNSPHDSIAWNIYASNNTEGDPLKHDGKYLPLSGSDGVLTGALLGVSMTFTPVSLLTGQKSIEGSYFPKQSGCHVTLYQDAVTPYNPLHEDIIMDGDRPYHPRSCWRDMYDAISNAQHLIYIAGWSLSTTVTMVRDDRDAEFDTIGDLLAKKAEAGVTVLGLVWDEKSSTRVIPGLMGTDDEETQKFFRDKNMDIELVYRKKEGPTLSVKSELYEWCYSHHQKCVIVDAQTPNSDDLQKPRHIAAFLGGLDIARGRYDTPEHPLFSTLKAEHAGDFYQKCVNVSSEVGPRQPWHDIHCMLEGPVAVDVLLNFEERWKKQVPSKTDKLVNVYKHKVIDANYFLEGTEEVNNWDCQIFRSITSDSVVFEDIGKNQLTRKAGVMCDDSIHRAYVHHIRRAQRFIYIENQYFLGSAYAWDHENKPKAHHLVPFEITNRIIEKIEAKEHFSVYIVLPMYPEGNPSDKVVQEILYWQKNTLEMMYKRIREAIDKHGLLTTPSDYLNVYCLGKREAQNPPEDLADTNPENVDEVTLRETRRFMVYVHSKMMIVDDEYIIVGSANVNQRSMGGTRDTEIAVGALQTGHVYDGENLPRGQIHGFRMALWAEHTGLVEECFSQPSSEECVQKINEVAQKNWEIYSAEETHDTSGYLMTYPYLIEEDGSINALPDQTSFPGFDQKAQILGKCSLLPNKLTT